MKCTYNNSYAAVKATNMLNDDVYDSIKDILIKKNEWTSKLQDIEKELQQITLSIL